MPRDSATPACPPVLLVGFNRPDLLQRTLASIAAAAPARLYVACDGARTDRLGEVSSVSSVRQLMLAPSWPCTVHSRFLDRNYGCMPAVSGAIDWFFQHEDAGIILEDDCVADPSFFPFAAELLARYATDERIGAINGSAFAPAHLHSTDSYCFTRYPTPWGWATWRRAWNHFERDPADWKQAIAAPDFIGQWCSPRAGDKWRRRVSSAFTGTTSSWAYRWHYAMWRHHMLAIDPRSNLMTNIGFTAEGTHTTGSSPWANLPLQSVGFPLRHPTAVVADDHIDRFLERWKFKSGPALTRHWNRLRWKLGLMSLAEARGEHEKRPPS